MIVLVDILMIRMGDSLIFAFELFQAFAWASHGRLTAARLFTSKR